MAVREALQYLTNGENGEKYGLSDHTIEVILFELSAGMGDRLNGKLESLRAEYPDEAAVFNWYWLYLKEHFINQQVNFSSETDLLELLQQIFANTGFEVEFEVLESDEINWDTQYFAGNALVKVITVNEHALIVKYRIEEQEIEEAS